MKVKVPFTAFVLSIGFLSLGIFLISLFDGEPNEPITVLLIIEAIIALIFIPFGIKLFIEDYHRYYDS